MKRFLSPVLLLLSALPATAHPAIFHKLDAADAARIGFFHPFSGLDHLLVMVAVGLWAVQIGGRALWLLPCSFVGAMLAGGTAALSGFHAPVAESGILASIVLLGAALGMAWRPSLLIASVFVAAAGLCHGYAHGSEMTAGLIPAVFFAGMIAATSLLHAIGVGSGLLMVRPRFVITIRVAGLLILSFALCNYIVSVL